MAIHSVLSQAKTYAPVPVVPPIDPETFDWDNIPGIYAKIDKDQLDSHGANSTHFPSSYISGYTVGRFPNSVYHELLTYKWMRGIQIDLFWGDIETSQGVYDWTVYDKIFEIIGALPSKGINGANKKILLLLSSTKTFSIADATRILPGYMLTTGAAYSNSLTGPLYIGTAQNPTYIDMPRYDHLWGFDSISNQNTTSGFGYHLRTGDYRSGLTGTNRNGGPIGWLKEREYAFLQACYDRYKDSPCLGGFISVEPSPLEYPVDQTGTFNGGRGNEVEYIEANHFDGRVQRLKDLKQIFTNHILIEAGTHNTAYQDKMTVPDTNLNADCCITNKLGFTGPNFHLGVNLLGMHNARRYMYDKVAIVAQCQGQDLTSIQGVTINNYWRWDFDPPDYGGTTAAGVNQGHPTTKISGAPFPNNDHMGLHGAEWVIRRCWYFRANILSFQRITIPTGTRPWVWPQFVSDIENSLTLPSPNTGGSIKDDPSGGLRITKPSSVV